MKEPRFMIVGVRADGSRCVLDQKHTTEAAQKRLAAFQEHLEGYREIVVEEVDPVVDARIRGQRLEGKCRHCHTHRVSRPRGLCWTCYYTPSIKRRYPVDSVFRPDLVEKS